MYKSSLVPARVIAERSSGTFSLHSVRLGDKGSSKYGYIIEEGSRENLSRNGRPYDGSPALTRCSSASRRADAESRFELMRRRGEGFPLYWNMPPRAAQYFFMRLLAVIIVAC